MSKKKSGILSRALALTVVASLVVIAKKVKDNNPEGIQDTNNDGVIDERDYISEIKVATKETYEKAKEIAKEKAPIVKEKASIAYEKAKDFAEEKAPIVKEKASIAYEKAKDFAKEKAPIVKENLEDALDDLKDKIKK